MAALLYIQVAHGRLLQLGEDPLLQAVAVGGQAEQPVQQAEAANGLPPGSRVIRELLKHCKTTELL